MKRIAMIVAGLLAAQGASAGVYVETVDHDMTANTTKLKQKMYVQNGSGRIVDAAGRATLIKGDTLYIIDDADKSYILFDKATMQQLATKLNAELARIKEQLAKLPPEQRAQMEQMMGSALDRAGMDRGRGGYRQVGQGRRTRLQAVERDPQWRAR